MAQIVFSVSEKIDNEKLITTQSYCASDTMLIAAVTTRSYNKVVFSLSVCVCVCVCVNQDGINHNCYVETYTDLLLSLIHI